MYVSVQTGGFCTEKFQSKPLPSSADGLLTERCFHAWLEVMKGTHRGQDGDCGCRCLNSSLRAVTQHGLEKGANKRQQ